MKVMVTGGAGFIGSHIVDLLCENGYDVYVLDDLSHGNLDNISPKVEFINLDIKSEEVHNIFEKIKPEVLIHHAAQIKVPKSIEDPIFDANVNIIGSINLLEASRRNGVRKIIYPSSAAIFGEPQYLPIDEQHPLNMISNYGISKHTVEHYLQVYSHLYNIDFVVFRYANVYGKRQDSSGEGGVISIFSDKYFNGYAPTIFGDGEQIRDFVYVKDVAYANLMAIEKSCSGIYNICTCEKTSINQLVRLFNKIFKVDLKATHEPMRLGDIKENYMSYNKVFNELGWKPQYNIESGLRDMLEKMIER